MGTDSGPVVAARQLGLVALAVVGYVLAAWSVTPGFYDGLAPPRVYRWVSPPPQFKSGNQAPQGGRGSEAIGSNGQVEPGTVSTKDGQASISFPAGAFVTPADRSAVAIDVRPVDRFPSPGVIHLATNVYCFTSSSPVGAGQFVRITLQFSTQIAAPSDVYGYQEAGTWRKFGNVPSAIPYILAADASTLGCFAAGYLASRPPSSAAGAVTLPIVAAVAISVVLIAGIPLLVLRRRGEDASEDR